MASSDDFSTLREQAMMRMRQMHANSNHSEPIDVPSAAQENVSRQAPPPKPKISPQRKPASPLSSFFNSLAGAGSKKGKTSSLLDELDIDQDKAIIGILIYILYKNGADIKLMLALGYLLI